ncbi:DUF3761 domain-containing protein [Mycobacterium asiaticum]|uniref:DUF3761 domain-containing protein n=1 Tax=Mycobacterium asiaticum TaxID=1790 RepID=UPI0009BE4BAB|nr:DUF3761 domain-containing protein [Mycobacterium asiaticum]
MRVRLFAAVLAISGGTLLAAPAISAGGSTTVLGSCSHSYYENSDGQCIASPSAGGGSDGATAICGDGTYSHSTHRSGTCSGHGGVKQWLTS